MAANIQEEEELKILLEKAELFISKRQVEKGLTQLDILLERAIGINSVSSIGKAYGMKGMLYYQVNNRKLAFNNYKLALVSYLTQPTVFSDELRQVYNSLGVLYKNAGDLKNAIKSLSESIDISDRFNLINSVAFNNLAGIYADQKEFDKALSYYKKALVKERKSMQPNQLMMFKFLSNIASIYLELKDYKKAENNYKKIYSYCEVNEEFEMLISAMKGLAILSIGKMEYENAETFLNRAIRLSERINYRVYLVDLHLYLAEVYGTTSRVELQLQSLQASLEIAKKYYREKELVVYEKLQAYHFNNNSIEEAYHVLQKLFTLYKHKKEKEKEERLLELQEKFESEQKDKLIKQEQAFNQTLKVKNLELAELNDDLAQFNHGVSHDLKEPIRLVTAQLMQLQAMCQDKLDGPENDALVVAQEAAERMALMLEDLYRFSTLSSGLKDVREVDLNEVLAIVQADLQLRIRDCDITIEVSELPTVIGYKIMYVQLFQNLINNAIKFRRKGLDTIVAIRYQSDKIWHKIEVVDNGQGIKERDQPHVFKLFNRSKENTYKEGSGVGLSIVRKIVKKMQGEISLASDYGRGTTFLIKLPKT